MLLTEGTNVIALHATDPAGNTFTTNLTVTLDYGSATNPTIQLTWPQNGLELCGDNFTVRGWTEDAAAAVSASITDNNGNTNQVTGLVERTGNVWVENLPLNAGTNFVTLMVTNTAGLSSETNFTVVKSSMTLVLTSVSGDLWLPTVNVGGTISDPTATVWVNGVQGTNNGDGTWSAEKVPVSAGGVASFDVNAIPAGASYPAISANKVKETEVLLESALWKNSDFIKSAALQGIEEGGRHTVEGYFVRGIGGSMTTIYEHINTNLDFFETGRQISFFSKDGTHFIRTRDISSNGTNDSNGGPAYTIAKELGKLLWRSSAIGAPQGWDKDSEINLVLHIGSYAQAGKEVFVEAGVGEGTEELIRPPYSTNIVVTDLLVDGLGENLDVTGYAVGKSTQGAKVKVNLKAPVPRHSFGNTAKAPMPVSRTFYPALTDTNRSRTTLGVGEEVSLYFIPPMSFALDWTNSAGGLSQTFFSSTTLTAPSNAAPNVAVTATFRGGKSIKFPPFKVVEPQGIDHAKIIGTNSYELTKAGAGMTNDVWIAPTSVSFYRVNFMEIGEDATNILGYYSQWTPQQLHHNPNPAWVRLTSDNSFNDNAAFGFASGGLSVWAAGGYEWNIPQRWQVNGSGVTNPMAGCNQVFSIDANGTARVTKYGNWIQRTTNNVITKN